MTSIQINNSSSYYTDSHAFAIFGEHLRTGAYKALRNGGWTISNSPNDALKAADDLNGRVLFENYSADRCTVTFECSDKLVYIAIATGSIAVQIAGDSAAITDEAYARVKDLFPRAEAKDDTIPVTFWSAGAQGPVSRQRRIDITPWDAVQENYAKDTHEGLHALMRDFTPSFGGQLLLWHGEPGTGKTHALRALGWEWRDWCDIHYIGDPETFFGGHASYMFDVLMGGGRDRWRLLVLEDSGELLTADAKVRTGQALSRLLNVVDGLIGQGLKILVLITTNEELKTLHEAVSRPGRCASIIEFNKLDSAEIAEWCKTHDCEDMQLAASHTVADLYAKAKGWVREDKAPKQVGFGA